MPRTKNGHLMLFRDTIAFHCLNQTEHTHKVRWQPADSNVTTYICSYLCVVEG
jgi:hypothetical protein